MNQVRAQKYTFFFSFYCFYIQRADKPRLNIRRQNETEKTVRLRITQFAVAIFMQAKKEKKNKIKYRENRKKFFFYIFI